MKQIKRIIGFLVMIYIVGGVFLYVYQRDFLYFPTDKSTHSYEIEKFSHDDVIIDVVVLNKGKSDAIIYHGGNAERVVNNARNFENILSEHTVYLINYRGYSGSTGSPTEQANYLDALYVYDQVKNKHHNISVIGRSLGTGVATYLAANREVSQLVLITPYDSIQNIAQSQYPIYPISLLLKDKYESSSRVNKINSKTLIILAEHDLVIPLRFSEKLIKEFSPLQVQVEVIKKSNHNNLIQTDHYYQLLDEFFKA
jgi:pimeloyl-ACP methyl ester carboxylesterase